MALRNAVEAVLADGRLADEVVARRLVIGSEYAGGSGKRRCAAATFAEQLPGLTVRYAPRTRPAERVLERLG